MKNFTVSGKFDPIFEDVPVIDVQIIQHPESLPNFKINAGTGTKFNFNIHIRSTESSVDIPPGIYSFEYQATCEDYFEDKISSNSPSDYLTSSEK